MSIAALIALATSRNGLIAIAITAMIGGVLTWDHTRITRIKAAEHKSTLNGISKTVAHAICNFMICVSWSRFLLGLQAVPARAPPSCSERASGGDVAARTPEVFHVSVG